MASGLRRGLLLAAAIGCMGSVVAMLALIAFAGVLSAGDDENPLRDARVLALHGVALALLTGASAALLAASRRAPGGTPGPPGPSHRTGTALVLVGSVLHVYSLATVAVLALWPALGTLHWDSPMAPVIGMAAIVILPGGASAGVALGWIAWHQARRQVPAAATTACIASLLPPLQLFTFIGAMLLSRRAPPATD